MSPRVIKITVLAIVAIVVVIGVRHYFSPGEVVKRKLIATIEAFEEERLLAVMSGISRSYSDPWGFDYETGRGGGRGPNRYRVHPLGPLRGHQGLHHRQHHGTVYRLPAVAERDPRLAIRFDRRARHP
jgi:hypothetical protein